MLATGVALMVAAAPSAWGQYAGTIWDYLTLAGTIGSAAEHDQALRLARDTNGVKRVVDQLKVVLP